MYSTQLSYKGISIKLEKGGGHVIFSLKFSDSEAWKKKVINQK
jgi:hypothetical protein